MQIARDDWSPLFQSLKDKVSADARRELLFQMINEIRFITQQNFGASGIDRPQPWQILSLNYAWEKKKGDRTPTLMLKGDLIRGFRTAITDNSATLTNVVPYAEQHEHGEPWKNLPKRMYYPINEDGSLTPFAEKSLEEVAQKHFQ
jgi:phage gpG-like protein